MGSLDDSQRELLQLPFFHAFGDIIIRQMPTESVPYAYFENAIPTASQRTRILRNKFGLHINGVPVEQSSLGFLVHYQGLTHLNLVGLTFDPSLLASMTSLVDLRLITGGKTSVDFAGLSSLEEFSGTLAGNESVFDAPEVRRIFIEDTDGKDLPKIPRQLRELDLVSARKVHALDARQPDAQLERVSIESASRFDIGSLTAFPRLKSISLDRVKEIQNANAFQDLSLDGLGLLNCGRIDDPRALADAPIGSVLVVGKLGEVLRPMIRQEYLERWEFLKRL